MCKKFRNIWQHRLWDYKVWSSKKSFFLHCAWQGQQTLTARGAKIFNYAILVFCTIVMYIMLGTCVPNLRGRWWLEHTQMHHALKTLTWQQNRPAASRARVLVYSPCLSLFSSCLPLFSSFFLHFWALWVNSTSLAPAHAALPRLHLKTSNTHNFWTVAPKIMKFVLTQSLFQDAS
jgi:hypothetical protein